MKAKFEEFNDGIVGIYNENDEGKLELQIGGLRFGEEKISVTRHYAAVAADRRVDRVIHVLQNREIKPHAVAVIGGEQYDIETAEHEKDTMPRMTRLSLVELEKHRKKEIADGGD